MAHREEVYIKTKFENYDDCYENCRDIKRRIHFTSDFSKKIHGEVYNDGTFELSSKRKTSNLFVFKGRIVERFDGIYMEGDIEPRPSSKYLVIMMLVFFIGMAVFMALTGDPQALIPALIFIIVPWIYVFIYFKSDALYKDLIKKLT